MRISSLLAASIVVVLPVCTWSVDVGASDRVATDQERAITQNQPKTTGQPESGLPDRLSLSQDESVQPLRGAWTWGEYVRWRVLTAGGGNSESDFFATGQTVGQTVIGETASDSYSLHQGFWQDFGVEVSCCGRYTGGFTGNTDCDPDGKMSLADITHLMDRIFLSKRRLCCEANGNVDGDPDGNMSLSDITKLIDHVYLSKLPTKPCP